MISDAIMNFNLEMFVYFQGNYDTFMQTRMELEENQMKKYKWEQDQISHMKVKNEAVLSCRSKWAMM